MPALFGHAEHRRGCGHPISPVPISPVVQWLGTLALRGLVRDGWGRRENLEDAARPRSCSAANPSGPQVDQAGSE